MNSSSTHIFEDTIINATDLNRSPGSVLDKALKHPVTITRRDEQFALLRRDVIAKYVEFNQYSQNFADILLSVVMLLTGQKIQGDNPYVWLSVFDHDELQELSEEISVAYRYGKESENWDEFTAKIHEWKESAIAIASPELEEAFYLEKEQICDVR
ncbi:MAG: hypothetical protein EA365_04405 [Gloeocapsa sp. DLM2.Bin57]|nr:MAG: hypothetical protein EA365_04405 [Gloeocapsa sp. DLM2.Bin57]